MVEGAQRAVVVGAGIGGLATAIGLRRFGWEVQVYEQASTPQPVGAGISLWSNAVRALEWLGVGAAIRDRGAVRTGGGVQSPDGRWLSRSMADEIVASGDVTMLMVHRAHLHEALLSALPVGAVAFASRLDRIEETDDGVRVHVTTPTGPTTDQAAVLVAADGLRSTVRTQLWPASFAPTYAGFTAWRGVTEEGFALSEQTQTLGAAAEVGLVQLQDGRVYWFATGDDPEGTRHDDERAEVLRRFGSWHEPIRRVVEATPPDRVLRHDLYRLPRPYPSFVRRRVALLGDAAHAMLPTLGQGGCLALEDAVVIADALARTPDVSTALQAYDSARRPRDEELAASSDRMARITQVRHPVGVAFRDLLVRAVPPRVAVRGIVRATAWQAPDPIP